MKKLGILFLLVLCSSCKKEETTTERLFLENLKETAEYYEAQCSSSEAIFEQKKEDGVAFDSVYLEKLKAVKKIFKNSFENQMIEDKDRLLFIQDSVYKKLNAFDLKYKYQLLNPEQLRVLNVTNMDYFIRCNFYKTHMKNLEYLVHNKDIVVCGFKSFTLEEAKELDSLYERIEEIKESD